MIAKTRRNIRLPNAKDLLLHIDFRFGEARDLVSQTHLTISGTGESFVYTRRHQALRLTSAGGGYIATGVAPPASGTVICLYRDQAGAGVNSPIFSDGFGATDEAISLYVNTSNDIAGLLVHSGGNINFAHSSGRLRSFGVVGFSWGNPGSQIPKIKNLNEQTASAWNFVLDTTAGVGDVRLNVRSDGGVSEFGSGEFGFFGLWNSPMHAAEMRQVARQLLSECELV